MPTVDITAPSGAFTPAATGNTQDVIGGFTISSGSGLLTCVSTTPFVSGDTGKLFGISLMPTTGANFGSTQGGTLSGTLTYVASNQVTLSAVSAITVSSSQPAELVWGSDDAPAFQACNTWAQAQTSPITVNMGTGSKIFACYTLDTQGSRSNSLPWGVSQPMTINGNGSSTTIIRGGFLGSDGIKSGDGHYGSSVSWTARLHQVNTGSTSVTCLSAGDAAQFPGNSWHLLTGIDLQSEGYPPNPFYYEYVFVTNASTTTGVITLNAPVQNTYLTTWPVKSSGNPAMFITDYAGPATLYSLSSGFNINVTYQNLGIAQFGQSYIGGLQATFSNVKSFDPYGITPTNVKTCLFTGCDLTSYQMEVDKMIDTLTFDNTQTGQLLFQSANNKLIIKNGSNVTNTLNGTARFTEIHNSTVHGLILGNLYFGRTDSFISTASTYTGTYATTGGGTSGDHTGVLQTDYSMAGGVITMPKVNIGYGCSWMIPGTYCYFSGSGYTSGGAGPYNVNWGPMFKILAVTDDAANIYVITDWPYGGFPLWATKINTLPSPYTNFSSDTVSTIPQITNWVTATAIGHTWVETYSIGIFNGSNIGIYPGVPFPDYASGHLVSYTINVTTPYTGVNNPLYMHAAAAFDNCVTISPDMSIVLYGPHIDLRTAGKRVITPAGANSLGLDSGLAMPSSKTWLSTFNGSFLTNVDITSEYNGNPSVGPVFTAEIITMQDTGFSVPLIGTGGIFGITNNSNMIIRR